MQLLNNLNNFLAAVVALTLIISKASAQEDPDPCFYRYNTIAGLFANCIPEASCSTGDIAGENLCPSFPSDYVCCFDERFPGREFRGAWISTVDNIDWPRSPNSSVQTQKEELEFLIDQLATANINAVFFQVRPAGDALYPSDLEPWSEYLTGTQGQPPSPLWDPLSHLITYCHERNIEVHAWMSPFRAQSGSISTSNLASNHMALRFPEVTRVYGNNLWMDPGSKSVQNHTISVVEDLIKRYDLDGIHIDGYFYPFPIEGLDFPDQDLYNQYEGALLLDGWRRTNVDEFIVKLMLIIEETNPSVKFTVSPYGLYRPGNEEGQPSPIQGVDGWGQLYANAKLWLQRGWVDALMPQLFWKIDEPTKSYPVLLEWWLWQSWTGKHVYAGNYLSQIDPNLEDWPLEEIQNQVLVSRDISSGNVMFSSKMFRDNTKGVVDFFKTTLYPFPSLTPQMSWLNNDASRFIKEMSFGVRVEGSFVFIELTKELKGRVDKGAVYKMVPGVGWLLVKVLNKNEVFKQVQLSSGKYAFSVVDRVGQESLKTYFEIV